jgi:hypothetical protein
MQYSGYKPAAHHAEMAAAADISRGSCTYAPELPLLRAP